MSQDPSNPQDTTGTPPAGASRNTPAPDVAAALVRMRAASPLVHCITNYVAMSTAANVVLAAGASPAMVHAGEEVADFAPMAGALTVNIGTLSPPWLSAMLAAAEAARSSGTPWVFDPVAHFITPYRRAATADLMAQQPTIVRGNASEILALAGAEAVGKGADAGDSVDAAKASAQALAQQAGCTVVVTGEADLVTDGTRVARIDGGHALMPKVTALGCALTALTGAYAATESDPFDAAVAACAHFGAAGALAGSSGALAGSSRGPVHGPGSFAVAFLDALANVAADDMGRLVQCA